MFSPRVEWHRALRGRHARHQSDPDGFARLSRRSDFPRSHRRWHDRPDHARCAFGQHRPAARGGEWCYLGAGFDQYGDHNGTDGFIVGVRGTSISLAKNATTTELAIVDSVKSTTDTAAEIHCLGMSGATFTAKKYSTGSVANTACPTHLTQTTPAQIYTSQNWIRSNTLKDIEKISTLATDSTVSQRVVIDFRRCEFIRTLFSVFPKPVRINSHLRRSSLRLEGFWVSVDFMDKFFIRNHPLKTQKLKCALAFISIFTTIDTIFIHFEGNACENFTITRGAK